MCNSTPVFEATSWEAGSIGWLQRPVKAGQVTKVALLRPHLAADGVICEEAPLDVLVGSPEGAAEGQTKRKTSSKVHRKIRRDGCSHLQVPRRMGHGPHQGLESSDLTKLQPTKRSWIFVLLCRFV